MSKFIKSSLWSLSANVSIRFLSLAAYPILVRYYVKSDIAIFKSFQAIALLLIAIIPLGTDVLFISTNKAKRDSRWSLFFGSHF